MKAQERHQLKENDFARGAGRAIEVVADRQGTIVKAVVALVVVAAIVAGVTYWRGRGADKAGALLGIAMVTAQAQIAPPSAIQGGTQAPGTYPSEKARAEAAIQAFSAVVSAYPNTDAGRLAAFQLASEYVAAGRLGEAEAQYRKLAGEGDAAFRAPLARLGLAQTLMLAGKTDEAIAVYTELAAARDVSIPVDGVLMEVGRAQLKAGKKQDARAAFKRVTDEFPESPYVTEARVQVTSLE